MGEIYTNSAAGGIIATINSIGNTEISTASMPKVQPTQMITGTLTGTQSVGTYGNVLIDGSNNQIVLSDPVTGNPNITITSKGYQTFTNPSTKIDQIIIGLLPDNTYGMVISKPGVSVESLFL